MIPSNMTVGCFCFSFSSGVLLCKQTALVLNVWARLASDTQQFSRLSLLSAGVIGGSHRAWLTEQTLAEVPKTCEGVLLKLPSLGTLRTTNKSFHNVPYVFFVF